MPETTHLIIDNLGRIVERMQRAAQQSGRDHQQIKLVAVTKYVSSPVARALVQAGCHELGESRPQQLWQKAADLADLDVRWHQVGHLQRNKVRRTLPLVSLIHAVDSHRLLSAIDAAAADQQRTAAVLVEVNISGEPAKQGVAPDGIERLLDAAATLRHVQIHGLMAMAGLRGGRDAARRDFARLRQLRDRLVPHAPPGVSLAELSMGMSNDFEQAILEGATLVRVGSALFEGLQNS